MSKVSAIIPLFQEDSEFFRISGKYSERYKEYFDYRANLYFQFVLVDENYKEMKRENLLYAEINFPFSEGKPNFTNLAKDAKDWKIYKVLNHLRKLCNAPELLSWD